MAIDYKHSYLFDEGSHDKQLIITCEDGTVITNEMLHSEQFELQESICSDTQLIFGSAEASCVKFRVSNIINPLKNRWITIEMVIDNHYDEPLKIGKYKVAEDTPTADRAWRDIVAYDAIYEIKNSDVAEWYNSLNFPMTFKAFRIAFLDHFNITAKETTLVNDNEQIEATIEAETLSGADVLEDILEYNGVFGRIGRDGLFEFFELEENYGGLFPSNDLYPSNSIYPLNVNSTDITANYFSVKYSDFETKRITRLDVSYAVDNDTTIKASIGEDGANVYAISDNMFSYGKNEEELQTAFEPVYNLLKKIHYMPLTLERLGNPCVEVGDLVSIHTSEKVIGTFVMQRTLKGIQALKDTITTQGNEYYTQDINGNKASTNRAIKKAVAETKGLVDNKISAYDEGIQALTNLMLQSLGTFKTTETLEDGSTITYIHSSPSLANSKTQWKMTADALAVSSDYGKTWSAGIDASGKAVVSVLEAIGIKADWIEAGTIEGNIIAKNLNIKGGSIDIETSADQQSKIILRRKNSDGDYGEYFFPEGIRSTFNGYKNIESSEGMRRVPYSYEVNFIGDLLQLTRTEDGVQSNMIIQPNMLYTTGNIYVMGTQTFTGGTNVYGDARFYGNVYNQTGGVVFVSDKDKKNSIEYLNPTESADFIYSLKPCEFKYNEGTSDRYHHGLIAQDVKEAMGDNDWGLYCEVIDNDDKYSALRYDELIADLIATVQSQNERIKALEEKLKEAK